MQAEFLGRNFLLIVQARMGSTRFREKVIKKFSNGLSPLEIMNRRLHTLPPEFKVVYAIPNSQTDDYLENYLVALGCEVIRGNEDDLLERYVDCAVWFQMNNIIKIPSDCPFICTDLIQFCARAFVAGDFEFLSNLNPSTFLDGMDIEIFIRDHLIRACDLASSKIDREHVTPYIERTVSDDRKCNVIPSDRIAQKQGRNLSNIRLTLDYVEDFLFLESIMSDDLIAAVDYVGFLNVLSSRPELLDKPANLTHRLSSWQSKLDYSITRFEKTVVFNG